MRATNRYKPRQRGKLYVCNSDGSQVRQLTQSDPKAYEGAWAWSPNSRHVAFTLPLDEGADIYVVGAEGGRPRQVTKHPAEDVVPTWSRDGKWIYFASNRSGEFQTWKAPFQGGDPVQVTRGGGYRGYESSDGWLYYGKSNPGEIWRVPLEGGEETRVLPGSRYWEYWSFASEGIYIAESKPKGEAYELRVDFLGFQSGETRNILAVEVPGGLGDFQVSPDEQWFLLSVIEPPPKYRTVDIMLVENFR